MKNYIKPNLTIISVESTQLMTASNTIELGMDSDNTIDASQSLSKGLASGIWDYYEDDDDEQ